MVLLYMSDPATLLQHEGAMTHSLTPTGMTCPQKHAFISPGSPNAPLTSPTHHAMHAILESVSKTSRLSHPAAIFQCIQPSNFHAAELPSVSWNIRRASAIILSLEGPSCNTNPASPRRLNWPLRCRHNLLDRTPPPLTCARPCACNMNYCQCLSPENIIRTLALELAVAIKHSNDHAIRELPVNQLQICTRTNHLLKKFRVQEVHAMCA
jgi:hypothetical protein